MSEDTNRKPSLARRSASAGLRGAGRLARSGAAALGRGGGKLAKRSLRSGYDAGRRHAEHEAERGHAEQGHAERDPE
jgi:hypothetical protein